MHVKPLLKQIPLILFGFFLCNNLALAAVKANDYQQFWLWAGVHPDVSILQHTHTLYVLQGEVSGNGSRPRLQIQGVSPVKLPVKELWLAWRVQRLDWSATILNTMIKRANLWQHKHNHVVGIQIDFDARTPQLANYAAFLTKIRQQLPSHLQLSITGLLDWTQTGDVNTLNQLDGVIAELVVQTYRGRKTITTYNQYLASLNRLTIPFKIGLVEGGDWDTTWQNKLHNAFYRGEVVFLVNPHKP